MSLTEQTWKEKAKTKLQQIQHWVRRGDAPYLIYGTVAGLSLWPVVEAAVSAPSGQLPHNLYVALVMLAGGVGSNLIAEQLQRWRDRAEPVTEPEVAAWITQEASRNAELRQAIDTLLTNLAAIPQAQAAVNEADRAWFTQVLQQELTQLGNLPGFEAVQLGDGAIAQGQDSIAVGKQGVSAGNVAGSVITGDNNRQVQATQYIEHYHAADPSQAAEAHPLRDTYLRRLLKDTNQLGLAGVDPKAASDSSEARLQLNAVYTALFTYSSEMKGGGLPGFWEEGRGKPASALAQLNQHNRLVLLGEPGGGKSTFVNFVAACMAGELLELAQMNLQTLTTPLPEDKQPESSETQPWVWGALLPVRVILRDLAARGLPEPGKPATADHLWAFLAAEDQTKDVAAHLRRQLEQPGGLLLLDGLDEVPEAHERRDQIRQLVEDLATTLPHTRLVVTSRTYAYQQQAWQLAGFQSAVLAPFTPPQIRYFVDRWYAHIAEVRGLHPSDAQGRAEQLKQAIFANERLQALAERPLLLTLMSSLHAWRGGSLPEKREKLYDEAVDLLLEKWENQRVVRDEKGQVVVMQPSLAEMLKVGREKVRELLHRLAYEAHKNQPDLTGTADIPQTTLLNELVNLSRDPDLKPKRLVEFLSHRAGLLLPHGVEMYTFPHRTFQEYLAACHLANADRIEELAELAQKDPHRWREVLLLAVARSEGGFTGAVWAFVDNLCPDPCGTTQETGAEAAWGAHLAGLALAETGNLENLSKANRNKVARVREWLVQGMRQSWLPALERAKAAASLARLGDPRSEATTVDGMHFCYIPQGPFWMGSDEDNPWEKDAERPLQQLTLPYDYWLGRFPVTHAQFAAFVAEGGYSLAEYWPEAAAQGWWKDGQARGYTWLPEKRTSVEMWRDAPYDYGRSFNLPNHPVVGINWYEMLAFTRWLTRRWQQAGKLPDGWVIQLPSEAEWEKAARGGLHIPAKPVVKTADSFPTPPSLTLQTNPTPQRRFPWGEADPTPEQANYEQTKIGSTSGVGCFPAGGSPYGCEEMAGTVWEWTRSLWRRYDREKSQGGKLVFEPLFRYPYEPGPERENLAADTWWPRVVRGGVWEGDETWLRCASRHWLSPHHRFNVIGFRIVASPFPGTSDPSEL